ncbi:MAG TPA: uridine diphosphate-N-acetylglucosamine-binding protein YvcK [Bryobacteraceae bacterium]
MSDPLRIVALGGGTGLSTLLRGLKHYAGVQAETQVDITAIVTVTDDGGSSGRLRRDFDVLPPGDIRNCMVALSEDAGLLGRLFQYRFQEGRGLRGHSFGNLFLTALSEITGNFHDAVRHSCEVLAIRGQIFPSTMANCQLEAELDDGSIVSGETRISRSRRRIKRIRLNPRHCRPVPEALDAIAMADLITLGPGSLFTSVIPNLLVSGIPAAIHQSPAVKAYFVNLMWQPGETSEFRASDHVRSILRHAPKLHLDYAILNSRPIRPALRVRYARQAAKPVENDAETIRKLGIEIVLSDLLEENEKVRHNPAIIAGVALGLAGEGRRRRTAQLVDKPA